MFSETQINAGGVYLFFTKPFADKVFVKVGMSSLVYERIRSILTGCPFDMDITLFTPPIDLKKAYAVEAAIHRAMAHRRTAREWFVLDKTEECLQEFNRAVFDSFKSVYGQDRSENIDGKSWIKWLEMTPESLADWVTGQNASNVCKKKRTGPTGRQQMKALRFGRGNGTKS